MGLRSRLDGAKVRRLKHNAQPLGIAKRKKARRRRRLRRHMSPNSGADPRDERTSVCRTDGNRRTPAVTQDPTKFRQSARRVREQHQAHAAKDRIEAAVREAQGFTVLVCEREVRPSSKPLTRLLEDWNGNVRCNNLTRRSNDQRSRLGSYASTGRNIEHALSSIETGQPQQCRDECRRNAAETSIVSAGAGVEVRPIGHGFPRETSRRRMHWARTNCVQVRSSRVSRQGPSAPHLARTFNPERGTARDQRTIK